MSRDNQFYQAAWVANEGPSCTTAAVLAGLGLLGVTGLPDLRAGTAELAGGVLMAPALLDYVALPGRPARLDRRIERLATRLGTKVVSRTRPVLPGWPLTTDPATITIAHLAWGQERPGVYGTWGFRPLDRRSWDTGGHSVVVIVGGRARWRVLDPNHPTVQLWPRPGAAVTVTVLRRTSAARPG